MPRAQRLPCCGPSCPKGGGDRHPPLPRNVLPCERAALPRGAKHPLGCSIAKRGWSCSVSAGRASRGGLLAEQGVVAGPAGSLCQTPVWERCGVCTALGCGRAEQLAMQLCHAGLGSGKARNSRGVTSSAFRLSSTCVCESTPLFFCETGCTRPPTGMVIKRETFI